MQPLTTHPGVLGVSTSKANALACLAVVFCPSKARQAGVRTGDEPQAPLSCGRFWLVNTRATAEQQHLLKSYHDLLTTLLPMACFRSCGDLDMLISDAHAMPYPFTCSSAGQLERMKGNLCLMTTLMWTDSIHSLRSWPRQTFL